MKKIISALTILTVLCLMCSCTGKTENETTSQTGNESTDRVLELTTLDDSGTGNTMLSAIPVPARSDSAALQNGETYTGRQPLPLQSIMVSDPENVRGLSTEKHGYGYGVSKDAVPNQQSVNNQSYFENNGYNAFCLDTKSTEKVLYLTFDCGYENGYTAKILDTLKEKNVTSAFFCTLPQVKQYPELIARMINEGHIVGNHSVKHPSFPTLTRLEMADEIKQMDDYLRTYFGYSEPFFRFPMGEYSDCALELVGSIGFSSVFWSVAYSDWDLDAQKGADYAFNTVTSRLHPGAVILLHSVSPDNSDALGRIIDWAREQGYTFKSLRDFN